MPKERPKRSLWQTRPNGLALGGQGDKTMFYVYVLLCKYKNNKSQLYIGSCSDLEKRFLRHKNKEVRTTKKFDKITLIYYEASLYRSDALKRERQLKTGFGRGYLKRRLKNI